MSSVSSLAYLGFDVSDLEAWERLAGEVLGLQLGSLLLFNFLFF